MYEKGNISRFLSLKIRRMRAFRSLTRRYRALRINDEEKKTIKQNETKLKTERKKAIKQNKMWFQDQRATEKEMYPSPQNEK